jgi:4-hydroxyacetophenone monooxygenase
VRDFKVIVIGAGFGGLCAAIRLKQLGIPFEVLEKNADVGGTWLENEYPGCAVDTPNHFYSYSFHVDNRWTRHFSRRDEIVAYIRDVTETHGLRPHIRFGAEATSTGFDEGTRKWRVTWRDREGRTEEAECNALICAVGPAEPALRSEDPRARRLRGADVPHGALGQRRRPRRASGWR